MYEMVTGRPPFEGTTMSDVLASLLDREPPPLARYSPGVPADFGTDNQKGSRERPRRTLSNREGLAYRLKALTHELERKIF